MVRRLAIARGDAIRNTNIPDKVGARKAGRGGRMGQVEGGSKY